MRRVRIKRRVYDFFAMSAFASTLLFGFFNQPLFASDYAVPVNAALKDAWKLYNGGRFSSAKMQFNAALRLEPNCPDAYNGLGLCSAKEGRQQESVNCYLAAIKLKPDFYNGLYNLANSYYLDNNYSEAISYYLRALKVSQKAGNGKEAEADLLSSLATVYRSRAQTLLGDAQEQDLKRALEFYHRSLKLNPNHPHAHAMLGSLYTDAKQYAAAERELRTAISISPNYSYAYYVLGNLYRMNKENPAALVAYQNSLKYENVPQYKEETSKAIKSLGIPEQLVDHFALGYEELNAANFEAAAGEFEAAANQPSPLKAIAINNAGFARMKAGDLNSGITSFKEAIAAQPHKQPEFYYNLGQAYLQQNNIAGAEKAFMQALEEAHGNHYLAHNAVAIVLKARADANPAASEKLYMDSLSHYNLALLQSSDTLSVVQFNRGVLLEKMARNDEAAECYTKYLQHSPSGLNAAAAKERLSKLKH